jgi:hypothetical protein
MKYRPADWETDETSLLIAEQITSDSLNKETLQQKQNKIQGFYTKWNKEMEQDWPIPFQLSDPQVQATLYKDTDKSGIMIPSFIIITFYQLSPANILSGKENSPGIHV